jgi:O-antigen/teichoic acid export membrane protein
MKIRSDFTKRVINAGSWSLLGYVFRQGIRFGSNLILTRLLFPEAFGIMSIVQTVLMGLVMISDLGIPHFLIRREQEPDEKVIGTVWVYQIVQGVINTCLIYLLASPMAAMYKEPLLLHVMPVVGLNALITGFNSLNGAACYSRRMQVKKIIIFEVFNSTISTLILFGFAWVDRSIWSLVWGGVVGSLITMIGTHTILKGFKHRLCWDKTAAKELIAFGKWIIARSMLTFVDNEGNKLLLGGVLGVTTLAFFNLANTMNLLLWQVIQGLSGSVLIPAYSEVLRERPQQILSVLTKFRVVFIAALWGASLFFIVFGKAFMGFLYDSRYAETGNMLRLLALGPLLGVLSGSYLHLLTAMGKIWSSTVLLFFKILIQVIAIIIGYFLYGEQGVLLGVAFAEWLYYPVNTFYYARLGFWKPLIDLPFIVLAFIIVYLLSIYTDIFAFINKPHFFDSAVWLNLVAEYEQLLAKLVIYFDALQAYILTNHS